MGDPVAAADVPAGTKWICPMDPEVESDKPGACPVCGMALEPELVTVEEGPNPEYVDMKRRFWVAVPLAAATLVLAMGEMIPGDPLGRFAEILERPLRVAGFEIYPWEWWHYDFIGFERFDITDIPFEELSK